MHQALSFIPPREGKRGARRAKRMEHRHVLRRKNAAWRKEGEQKSLSRKVRALAHSCDCLNRRLFPLLKLTHDSIRFDSLLFPLTAPHTQRNKARKQNELADMYRDMAAEINANKAAVKAARQAARSGGGDGDGTQ